MLEHVEFLEKFQRIHIQITAVTLKMALCKTVGNFIFLKNSEIQDFVLKTNFFWHHALEPLGSFSHIAAYRSSLKNIRKLNIQPILNKNSPWAHMELEFEVLGVVEKLVKYVIHLSKRKVIYIYISLLKRCSNNKRPVLVGLKEF
jgi:hypothetical protein